MRLSIPSPLLRPWSLPGLAALLLLIAATVVIWAGTGPAGAQDGYQPDEQVVSDVWGYARETDNGFAHVLRWLRALHTFGAIEDMTAAEAQGYAEQYTAERWDPVVAELERLEADDGYEPDQQVTADVWDYARETGNGFAHVLRWLRVLKTFGEVSDMTSAEAQGYADQYTAERWNPVAAELSKLEAAATPPNRAPVVNTEAGHYYDFTGINNAPRGVLVSKPFHGVFSDPDGDELTYSVAIPGDQSHLVELLEVVRDEDVPVQEDKPREDGMLTRVWFRAEAAADWKALDPPLMNCPVVPATVTATDPEGLSVSLDAPFLIRWECYPEVVRATASREAIALTSDWEVESDPAPKPEQFTAHMVNGDGSQGTVAVSDVSVKGKVVRLALASELAEGQRVTVDYADDYRTPLRLAGGDDGTRAPGFTGQPVALDVSGPAFAAAKVSGATLKVTFNEELDAESTPSGSAFTVSARLGGGEARSIAGTATARVEGAVVTVGLAEAVHGGHTVTVAYAPPEDDPVRDLAGNPAGAFSGEDVTNETPAIDPGAPRMALISATIKGATLTLAYNNDVHLDWNTRSVPDVSRFAVTVNGETVSLAANRPVSVSTSTVILTLKQAVSASDTVTVSYTADWWDSIHSFGHRCCGYLYADNLTNHPVTNIMSDGRAPTLSAAAVEGAGQLVSVVDSKGAVVTLTFDEQLDPNAEPAPEAFSVTVNGVPVSFRSYSWRKGGRPVPALWDPVPIWINGHTVMLTLAGKVAVGHEVAVRYEPPQSGAKLQDLAGNPVAAFAATEVENRTRTSPPLIADAWNYARDTESGYDHVSRWLRLLKTLGALAQMTAAEAQGYADGGLPRWAPVAEDLRKLENAPGDYQPDAQVIDDVQGYARETGKGFPHVLRWMRTLQALGALADMTWAEAHGYANQHQAARWDPVAAELASMDAAKASIPVAPANFAISGAPGSLDLSATWDALEGATSYKLAWRQSGEEFETGDANTVSETEATVTVSGYGQWVMQLRACNEAGCGPTAWLPIVVSADAAPRTPTITPVCYRTPEVREILAKYVRKECADITAADLAEIDKIRWGDLEELTSLKSGDFDGLYNLEGLYFLDHQLTTLPEDIFNDLHSLQELQMSIWHGPFGGREGLTALPEDVFADLSNLRELDLAGNRLRTLPDGVFDGLSSLQTLNLEVTSLTALPEDVFDGLSSLQTLILEDNELSTLPAGVFDDLSSLQILNLHGNDLAELPDVFDGLSSLQTLNLGSNELLTTLPEDAFDGLSNLQTLDLRYGELTALPEDAFHGLSNLQTLDLGYNDLTALPEDVFDGLSNLQTLILDDNELTTALPEDVFNGLSSLQTLNLADVFHRGYTWKTWHLEGIDVTALPEDLFDGLSSLQTLDLGHNGLRTLPEDAFDGLSSLQTLMLESNDLTELPEDVFDGLSSLQSLDLSHNYLTELTEEIFDDLSSLESLDLRFSRLSELSAGYFDGLTNLQELDLSNSGLATLSHSVFSGLNNLQELNLSQNDLTTLSAEMFNDLPQLRKLDLSDNPGSPFGLNLRSGIWVVE